MGSDLSVGAAERDQSCKSQQFSGLHVKAPAGIIITETICGKIILNMFQFLRRCRPHAADMLCSENQALNLNTFFQTITGIGRALAFQRQPDASLGQNTVGEQNKIICLGRPA